MAQDIDSMRSDTPISEPPPLQGASFSPRVALGLLAIMDGLLVLFSGLVIYVTYVGWDFQDTAQLYVTAFFLQSCFVISTFYFVGLYDIDALFHRSVAIKKIIITTPIIFLILVSVGFALKISFEYSRVWAFSWYAATTVLLCLTRLGVGHLVRRWAVTGRFSRNVVVVGASEQGARLINALNRSRDPWIRILGIFDDRIDRVPKKIGKYAHLGNLDDLIAYARSHRVDEVLIALPWWAEERLLGIIDKVKVLPAMVRLSPDKIGLNFLHTKFGHCGGVPMLNIFDKPISDWNYVLKAIEDRMLSVIIVLCIAPVLLLTAIAVKTTTRGPILFKQPRYGFNNQLFDVYKFRTMYVDQSDINADRMVTRDDPRVTSLGAFLRKTSLDELPQFFNVLKGDMSIVGPRPHALRAKAGNKLYEEVVSQYALRHKVKPGITGWAQVNGWRGETDKEEKILYRLEHDLYYIENWSILFDLQIILRTIWIVIRGKNAY